MRFPFFSKKACRKTVRREGQPDYFPGRGQDLEMAQAIQAARESVDTFIAALSSPTANQTSFSVKKPFNDGEQVENIWLSGVSFNGTKFSGRVDNEPVDVKTVRMGDIATAEKDEISDWFFVDNGKLAGGYTLRVLYARMSSEEKSYFDTHVDFEIE